MAEPTLTAGENLWGKIRNWLAAHPYLALTLAVLAALGPFLAKPFNIDDPLFIWAARQIQAHPGNPYGFDVNWYGETMPMWQVTKNPPLACYYLALAAKFFGWSEMGLRFAFLFPAIAVILGTNRLAGFFCGRPLLAALAALFTPVFFVSSTTLMCDVLMLAFWMWAVVCWIEGTGKNQWWKLFCAAAFISLAAMTKYFGVCLVPLLAVYSLLAKRKFGRELFFLLIPVAVLCLYQWWSRALYGHALLSDAVAYTKSPEGALNFSKITASLNALTFTGGCAAIAVFFAPLVWRARTIVVFIVAAIFSSVFIVAAKNYPWLEGVQRTSVELQVILWVFGGISILALAGVDLWERRDARSGLLALWVAGTFLFAALLNWTVNGRSILPMVPAVGILLVRRLEQKNLNDRKIWTCGVTICVAASAILAFFVAQSDFLFANAVRASARATFAKYGKHTSFWYQGHWGFQYYLGLSGAMPLDIINPPLKAGDILAIPFNNTNIDPPKNIVISRRENLLVQGPCLLTTDSVIVGAGFYASTLGPLPFAFGHVPPENIYIYDVKANALPAK